MEMIFADSTFGHSPLFIREWACSDLGGLRPDDLYV